MHRKYTLTSGDYLADGVIASTLKIKIESYYKLQETQENIPLKIHKISLRIKQ